MSGLLDEELHLHLYGCLTAEDIFDLGKDHYEQRADALDWYAAEYLKITGRPVHWRSYFSGDDGPKRIRADFLADVPMTFPAFQARFNLMIALLPTVEFATKVMRHVVLGQVRAGLKYAEHRVFVPPTLDETALTGYYQKLAACAAALNSDLAGQFSVRVILSVSRNPDTFNRQYAVLRALQSDPNVAVNVTGVDFCGIEEGFPPENLSDVFAKVRADNAANPDHALALLYHVGESFDGMSIFSAMRWISKSVTMGAHRLGHATAAGLLVTCVSRFGDGCRFTEPRSEALSLLGFLQQHPDLQNDPAAAALRKIYRAALDSEDEDILTFVWNEELRQIVSGLQLTILRDLASAGITIESCPTSNRIIGRIDHVKALPVFQFANAEVPFVISTDDPGIFATSLGQEETLCRQGGMDERLIARAADYTKTQRAGLLAGRASW